MIHDFTMDDPFFPRRWKKGEGRMKDEGTSGKENTKG
jgi:hypothetical protein